MSGYTRAVNTPAHGSAGTPAREKESKSEREREREREREKERTRKCVCSAGAFALVYRNARGQSNPPTCVEDATCKRWIVYVASDR